MIVLIPYNPFLFAGVITTHKFQSQKEYNTKVKKKTNN